jgi:hypothetical protein
MKTNKYIGYYFESSTRKTPEFNNFARAFRTDIKEQIKDSFILEDFSIGHFYISGFLKSIENGKYVYFSISDVRHFLNEWSDRILIRTAQHLKDYTGGSNNFTTLEEFNSKALKLIK